MNDTELNMLYVSILEFMSESKSGFKKDEDIFKEFIGTRLNKTDIKSLLRALEQMQFVEKSDKDPQRIQFFDDDFNEVLPAKKITGYKITRWGKSHIGKQTVVNQITYSGISNSAIAHNSPHAVQSVRVGEQDEETQILLKEYIKSLESKDSKRIKKAIGYILDKSIDLGIAVLVGGVIL